MSDPVPDYISVLERPHPNLWKYYIFAALCTGRGAHVPAAPGGTPRQITAVARAAPSGAAADAALSRLLGIRDEREGTRELLGSAKPSATTKPAAGASAPAAPQKPDWWKG